MSNGELFDDALPDDVLDHLGDPEIRARWPEALVTMMEVARLALVRELEDEQLARRLSAIAVRALAKYHGGRMFYLPKGDELDRAIRDKRMWDVYDGTRSKVLQLADEHGLTEQQTYAILNRQRAIHRKRIQPSLLQD